MEGVRKTAIARQFANRAIIDSLHTVIKRMYYPFGMTLAPALTQLKLEVESTWALNIYA